MAEITIQASPEAGAQISLAAASAGGDQFSNTGREVLIVNNADAGSRTVTITAQDTSEPVSGFGNMSKSNIVAVVPTGEEWVIGPFPTKAFNDSGGKVQVTYDAATSTTVGVVRVTKVA